MQRRLRSFLCLLVAFAFVLTGCGGGKSMESPKTDAGSSRGAPAAMPPSAAPAPAKPSEGSASSAMKVILKDPASANAPQSDRKIILNAETHIKVEDVERGIATLREITSRANGYVASSQITGQKTSGRQGHVVLRIPSGQYTSIMLRLRDLGELRDEKEWTQDVTAEFLDLQPRIAAKEKHLEQLMKLYDRGGTTEELMRLTTEIDRVQGELDSLKGRLKYLTNQVDFSTITVRLYEEGTPAPPPPPKTVWERAVRSFMDSTRGLVIFLGNLAVGIIGSLPWLVFWGVVGTGGVMAYRKLKARRNPPAPPASPD